MIYASGKYNPKPTSTSTDKTSIGLGNVTNDAQVKRSEMGVASGVETLTSDGKLTHMPSASDVGLGNVTNDAQVKRSEIGIANGIVPLNANSKIDLTYLTINSAKIVGVSNTAARLALSAYDGFMVAVESDTLIAYGINANLDPSVSSNWVSMGDVSSKVESVNSKTGVVTITKSDIGLDNVDNTADASKSVLSATKLTTARTINSVSFDGTTNITIADSTKVPTTTTVNGHALSSNVAVTASDVGLGNVTNESKSTMFSSPSFTGTPTSPTAASGTNTTQIATTAFVISNIPSPSYLKAYNSITQTLTAIGNIVSFASIEVYSGSDITLSNSCFLLKAGNSYEMSGVLGLMNFSGAGWIQFRWRTGQVGGSGTWIGNTAEIDANSMTGNTSGGTSIASAIFAPTADTYVHLEVVAGNLYTSIAPISYATIKVLH